MSRPLIGFRVLVVEDEFLLADELAMALSEAGATVVGPCATVRDALERAREDGLDGAVLDLMLAGESVLPVAEVLEGRRVPFVLASAVERWLIPPGLARHPRFGKPVDIAVLVRALADAIAARSPTPWVK